MAFIILGSVGSAIGAGLTAAGLGTIGGAVSGAAGSLAGALGSGLSALGATSAGAAASSLGAGAASAGAGAGAAIGAPVGMAAQGIGSLMGGAGGATAGGGAVGQAATAAGFSPGALAGAVPASSGTGIAGGSVFAGGSSAALPTTGSVFMGGAAPSFASMAGSELGKEGLKEGIGALTSGGEGGPRPSGGGGGRPQSRYAEEDEMAERRMSGGPFSNPFSGFAEGGLTTLKGGGIAMRDGQYVIPADVVSAIGNGSSKAGARFLEQAFNYYIENGPPEGVKPPPRAGNLAERRAMEKMG